MDKKNPHFNSKNASLSSVIEATKDELVANGLSVTQHCYSPERGAVSVITMMCHSTGQWYAVCSDDFLPR